MGPIIPTKKGEIIIEVLKEKKKPHDFKIQGFSMFVDKISHKKKHLHACRPSTISVSKFILSTALASK